MTEQSSQVITEHNCLEEMIAGFVDTGREIKITIQCTECDRVFKTLTTTDTYEDFNKFLDSKGWHKGRPSK